MKRLFDFINNEEGFEKDRITESFNTTLYSYFNEEQEYNDNDPGGALDVINKVKKILNDGSAKYIQKALKIDRILRAVIEEIDQNWHFKAIKDDAGNIFVALRRTKKVRRPFNLTVTVTSSVIALINTNDKGVFVYDADEKEYWDDERKTVVEKVLDTLGCVRNSSWQDGEYTIGNEKVKLVRDKVKQEDDEDNDEDNENENDKDNKDDDSENSKSSDKEDKEDKED